MHLKRNKTEKFWPIKRKGKKYIAVASHNKKVSIPLIVVARDILGIVLNSKELKRALNEKKILVNQKIIQDTNFPVTLFDVLSLNDFGKNYKAVLGKNKKFSFEDISEKEAETKIDKVVNKKLLKNKKVQIGLSQGRTFLSDEKISVNDSVVFNLKTGKVVKIIPMQKGERAFVLLGKHRGATGKIESISEIGNKKLAEISANGKIRVWIKNLMVVE